MKAETTKKTRVMREIYVTCPYNTTEHTRRIYCSIDACETVKKAAEKCQTWNELKKEIKTICKLHPDRIIAYTEN